MSVLYLNNSKADAKSGNGRAVWRMWALAICVQRLVPGWIPDLNY